MTLLRLPLRHPPFSFRDEIRARLRGFGRCALRCLAGAALALSAGTSDGGQGPSVTTSPARFVVRDAVERPNLQPFTATTGAIGAELVAEGFEPILYRDRLVATEDAPDRIVAEADAVSNYNSLREGALDGAEVDIYRIEDGVFRRVRQDRVAEGGFHASGWFRAGRGGEITPRDRPRAAYRFAPWSRPNAETWFAVQAVTASGALSVASEAVRVVSPEKPERIETDAPRVPAPKGARTAVRRADGLPRGEAPPPAPTGLEAVLGGDGVVRLSWDASPDPEIAGYVLLISDYPPERHRGFALDLVGGDGKTPIRVGDLAIVSKSFRAPARGEVLSNRVWNAGQGAKQFRDEAMGFWPEEDPGRRWRLAPHGPDSPVAEGGETHLELILAPGEKTAIGGVNHGSTAQDWYPVLEPKPYKLSVWLRADRDTQASFRFTGPYRDRIRPIVLPVGPEWRRVEAEFIPPAVLRDGPPGAMQLVFEAPGVYEVDNFRVWPAETGFLDAAPETYARLEESGIAALRTHALVKTGRRTYDLAQLTNPGGVTSTRKSGNTLPQTLAIMARGGVDPWLQIEPHLSPEEWLGLVEFLAAPFDREADDPEARPWAAKRVAQGRTAPWTDAFDRLYLEIGNETWNRLFTPWTWPSLRDAITGRAYTAGEVYGLQMEQVIRTLRSSPWWREAGLDDKVVFVLGGWRFQPYGEEAAAQSPSSDVVTVASYNGGWDVDQGPPDRTPASYFNVLNNVSQGFLAQAETRAEAARAVAAERGRPLGVGSYEGGPGYAMNGLNGQRVSEEEARAQEEVMKSRAAGVATLDSFLAQATLGFEPQNFFTFGKGQRWSSHATWNYGGAAYPSWMLLSLFNRLGTGDMLAVETVETPRADLPEGRHRAAAEDAPLVAVYATREGDRVTLVVVSRRVPNYPDPEDAGYTPVEIALPFARAERLTLHRLTGAYDANNVDGPEVGLESVALTSPADLSTFRLDAAAGLDARSLPPAQALVYVFEGVSD